MAFQLLCSQIFMQWTPLQRKRLLYISRTNRPGCLLMARNVPQDLHKMHSISLLQKHPIHKSSKFRANQNLRESRRILFISWIILNINRRKEGRCLETTRGGGGCGSICRICPKLAADDDFGRPAPLDPSRFEPLIELLQQTRDFARLNLDLTKCLS